MALIPFKWVGGKGKLAEAIGSHFPLQFGNYYEPFCGASAVFFNNKNKIKHNSLLSDTNTNVIYTLATIQNGVVELIERLKKYDFNEFTEEQYYLLRADDRKDTSSYYMLDYAVRFMIINRLGYCGLWRENSKGQCNTPFGHYKNPKVLFEDELNRCNELLNQNCEVRLKDYITLFDDDFGKMEESLPTGLPALFYIDPPYVNYSNTKGFTGYGNKGFKHADNVRLRYKCLDIHKKGHYFIQSNLFSEEIIDLYGGFCRIHPIDSYHGIGAPVKTGSVAKEVIIKNFP